MSPAVWKRHAYACAARMPAQDNSGLAVAYPRTPRDSPQNWASTMSGPQQARVLFATLTECESARGLWTPPATTGCVPSPVKSPRTTAPQVAGGGGRFFFDFILYTAPATIFSHRQCELVKGVKENEAVLSGNVRM